MLTERPIIPLKQPWQKALSEMVTDPKQLFTLLGLDPSYLNEAQNACHLFPLRATHSYLSRMQKGNIKDPLLLQILPLGIEQQDKDFSPDPLDEKNANPVPGLLHKYKNRALLIVTGTCAVNCRFCFRRHFAYSENNPGKNGWEKALVYIEEHPEINEVIYSGGDPLMLNDDYLAYLSEKVANIPHIKYLRIHSRLPIVQPNRINDQFISWFKKINLQKTIVVHCNHVNEVNAEVIEHINVLKKHSINLFNQAVILKGINDSVEMQIALCEKLFSIGVQPYYLHLLDKVQGAAHFEVPFEKVLEIVRGMRENLPGYLMPKLVEEVPRAGSKVVRG
jgi:EF-P beta-lysylation protein EpmB